MYRATHLRPVTWSSVSTNRLISSSARLRSRLDVLNCAQCSLFKFGDPTSEPAKALFRGLTWRIRDGTVDAATADAKENGGQDAPEAWAVIGPRAGQLVDAALLGRARADPPESRSWPMIGTSRPIEDVIKKVSFTTRLESNSYLAQAGEFTDYTARYYGIRKDDEDATTLRQHLRKYASHDDVTSDEGDISIIKTAALLKLDHLLDIPLIALSNGQTRRARIARALLTKPEVLVLEEPFTGLDVASRKLIADLLGQLHVARTPRIVLVLRPQDEVPCWVDKVAQMGSQSAQEPVYLGSKDGWTPPRSTRPTKTAIPVKHAAPSTGAEVFTLLSANVQYADRHILKDISWQMKEGGRAVLTGANGSGKSTLLSLILGDHPASYSQDLSLFSRPRSHHSAYSLSRLVGHYSPELFAAFPRRYGDAGLSIHEVIGSGFENIFTYRKLTDEQKVRIAKLVQSFDPDGAVLTDTVLHKTLFAETDPSLQALSLILRAAVKNPKLLILDEPFAGMSPDLVQQCRTFLDHKLLADQSLIFISHYEDEWPASIRTRMHLENGRGTETILEE